MTVIDLRYGRGAIPLEYDPQRFDVLAPPGARRPLSDFEIGARLDSPVGSGRLEAIVSPGETVLFVVPDATRQSGAGQIVNLLVRRLIANGTAPFDISVIFSTGIHRRVTDEEKQEILSPFIAQRIKAIDHDPHNLMRLSRLGETHGGITVELNRALTEFDHVVPVGAVLFHYFAGFTGGRKMICPGLASSRTISATHKLAFDYDSKRRREGVMPGKLDGNPVHEAFAEAAAMARVSFAVNTIVDDDGSVAALFCGDLVLSHREACETYATDNTVQIPERRPLVIVSCGGYPYDIDLIQSHKALEAASHACSDGGRMILLAECADGAGREGFMDWFDAANSDELAERLCQRYQVNGQTAWSLLRMAEKFEFYLRSDLEDGQILSLRARKVTNVDDLNDLIEGSPKGYIIPNGSRIRIQ
jgi:lactate racemase